MLRADASGLSMIAYSSLDFGGGWHLGMCMHGFLGNVMKGISGIKQSYFMIKIGVFGVSGVVAYIVRDLLCQSGPEGVLTGRESTLGAA